MTRFLHTFLFGAFLFLSAPTLYGQDGRLNGRITDENGQPVAGAVVYVKGTSNGTTADSEGVYQLSGLKSGDIIVFSLIPSEKELVYNGESSLDVVLEEKSFQIEDAVVIGYGQVRSGDVTGSLTSVKVDEMQRGFAPRAQDLLVGKVAGVSIINEGGAPSGNSYIRIRGGSSLSANNEPLIILDGVYIDSQGINGAGNILSTINPSDIESFTVLKDASSTAIYGSRASNGVILITTKKGSSDGKKVRFAYDGNISVGFLPKKIDVMTGDEYRVFLKDRFGDTSLYSEMASRTGLVNTDWQKEIFRPAVNTEHNLSVYGSAGKWMPYRISMGIADINGILKTSKNDRYTLSIALSPHFFKDHLKLDLTGRGMYAKNRFADWGAVGSAIHMDPTQAVYDPDSPYGGYFAWMGSDHKVIQVATSNPVSTLNMLHDEAWVYNFKGNAQITYECFYLKGLSLNASGSIDTSSSKGHKRYDPWMASDYMYGGYDSHWTQKITNTTINTYFKYDLHTKAVHFDIMGGYEWQKYWRKGWTNGNRITQYDIYGDPIVVDDNGYENAHYLISFFGRSNLSVLDRYLLTVTIRDDGSSRFAKKNRWALFPSLALAWRISEEPFMKNVDWLSSLKLRLGWGITGQQEINVDYGHIRSYLHSTGTEVGYIRGYNGGAPIWSELLRPESYNPDLKWESTTTYNIGIDWGVLKGRGSGSIDVYHRTTKDLINLSTRRNAGTNFKEFVATNIGSLENIGFEMSTDWIIFDRKDFGWDVSANVAYNHNKITRLASGDDSDVRLQSGMTVNMVGQPANSWYVYEQIYDDNGKPIEGLYVDRNGDGEISSADLRPFKHSSPDWTLGLRTKLRWRSFDFSVSGHGSFGVYNYNAVAADNAALSATSIYVSETLLNRAKSAFETNFEIGQPLSDYYVQDASFFRIDNIILGWSFQKQVLSSRLFSGRLYLNVQNPVTFTRYKGQDPEVFGGYDGTLYPRPATFLLGVSFNL